MEFALRSYATNVEGPASFFTADSLFVVTSQSERFYAQVSVETHRFEADLDAAVQQADLRLTSTLSTMGHVLTGIVDACSWAMMCASSSPGRANSGSSATQRCRSTPRQPTRPTS